MTKIIVQPPVGNFVDETYEKIRKQSSKVFAGTTDLGIAEEWLRSTNRILDRFEYTIEKKVSYDVSLFEQDAFDWCETVSRSKNVSMTLTWEEFLREFVEKYTSAVYRDRKKIEFLEQK